MNQNNLPFDFVDYTFFSMAISVVALVVGLMIAALWIGWRWDKRRPPTGPYGHLPLRSAAELPYATIGKIYLYLTGLHQYDNRMFSIHRAAVCRITGRIFPNAIDIFGRITCDWTFLQKKVPGNYISWGSLNDTQQAAVKRAHASLEGFQTKMSSPEPSPRAATEEYLLTIPGPLYVDLESLVLLGWKQVPGTEVEVLIVQHPKTYYSPTEV